MATAAVPWNREALNRMQLLLRADPAAARKLLERLSDEERFGLALAARFDWARHVRPEQQLPDGDWDIFVMLAGRGGGKTRPAAETVLGWSHDNPLIALMAKDAAMVRDVMIEGESGILACCPPWMKPKYDHTKLRLTYPNGCVMLALTAEARADAARGRQFYKAWAEEVAAWPHVEEAWHQGLQNALRLGRKPQTIVTTTPKLMPFISTLCLGPLTDGRNRLIAQEQTRLGPEGWTRWEFSLPLPDGRVSRTVVARWKSDRNSSNLAPGFVARRREQYGSGSRMAQQELDAEILTKIEGALWQQSWLERCHVSALPSAPSRVLVSVDPSHSDSGAGDAAGIIVGAKVGDAAFLMDDRTVSGSPLVWARAAVAAYDLYKADAVVIEVTAVQTGNRGHVVKDTIRAVDPGRRIKWIEIHHGADKSTRAEPVAAMYERNPGRVFHVDSTDDGGRWSRLEDEYLSWDPETKWSPNRLDAAVQLVTALLMGSERKPMELL
jgi:phage terminase large subunit-like protein